jgi:hypothetical protein
VCFIKRVAKIFFLIFFCLILDVSGQDITGFDFEEGYWASISYLEKLKEERFAPFSFSMKIENEYNDNIFSTEDKISRDFIHYIIPGFIINSRGPRHTVFFDYELRITRHNNFDPYLHIDLKDLDYIGHRLNFEANRIVSDQLKVGIEDKFLVSRKQSDMNIGTNRISAAKYLRNWTSPYMQYQINERAGFTLKYTFDNLKYRESFIPSDEDTKSHSFNFSFGYIMGLKTQSLLTYQNSSRDYDRSTGYKKNQFIFGIKRLFNSKIKAEIFTGYEIRKFDREIKGVVEDMKDYIGGLQIIRETKMNMIGLSYNHYPADIGEDQSYYTVDRFSLNLLFLNFQKIKFSNSFFYQIVSYDKLRGYSESGSLKKRDDKLFGFDLFIDYLVKPWLSISLGYTMRKKDSNIIDEDYKENRLFLSIDGVFELWR